MELWASGFNAWNQLRFDKDLPAEPQDLSELTCVLKDVRIEVLRTSLSATLGKLQALSFHVTAISVSLNFGLPLGSSKSRSRGARDF